MEYNRDKDHKGFKIFVLLFLICLIFFMKKDNRLLFKEAYNSLIIRDKALVQVQSIELDENVEKVGLFNKNIAMWYGNKLSIIDIDSNLLLEKQFNFETPNMVFGEKSSYIMDKYTGDIYIINNKGETIERVSLDNRINNLIEDKDNSIVHTGSEEDENIVILNNKGVFLRVQPVEEMNILTYNLDKKADKYLISELVVKDGLKSQVNRYSIDGELLNTTTIDNEIIIFTEFVEDDLIALTDKCLYLIRDDKIYWRKSLSNTKDIVVKDNEIYIIYGENLEIINLEGKTIEKIFLTEQLNRISHYDKLILLWGNHDLLGIQANKQIIKYKHDKVINNIIINKDYLGLVDNSSIHLFKIDNK